MAKRKRPLIPQEDFDRDFMPLSGFYDYHVIGKRIPICLDEIQRFGVHLDALKEPEIANVDENALPINEIKFSSSTKSNNVKNLTWCAIRCLIAHPENITKEEINGVKCYRIKCSRKDNKTQKIVPTMKGLVACETWSTFTQRLMNIIEERAVDNNS